jgi:hypothetical protein
MSDESALQDDEFQRAIKKHLAAYAAEGARYGSEMGHIL